MGKNANFREKCEFVQYTCAHVWSYPYFEGESFILPDSPSGHELGIREGML